MSQSPASSPSAFPWGQSPAPPVESLEDLVRTRVTYGPHRIETPEQVQWAIAELTRRMPGQDVAAWLRPASKVDLMVELKPATPSQPAVVTQPPVNPISDSLDRGAAQPEDNKPEVTAGPQPVPTDPALLCCFDRIGMCQRASLRGLKMSLTKSHKLAWEDYCGRFGLSLETGLPGNVQPPPAPDASSHIPKGPPPPAPGLPTTVRPDGVVVASQPPTPSPGAPQGPSSPPVTVGEGVQATLPFQPAPRVGMLPQQSYVGIPEPQADYRAGCMQHLPRLVTWNANDRLTSPAEVEEAYSWLEGAFLGIDGVKQGNVAFQMWSWLSELNSAGLTYEMPVVPPSKRMRKPEVPMFDPSVVAPVQQLPASQGNYPAPPAIPAAQHPDPAVRQAAAVVMGTFQPAAQVVQPLQSQPQPVATSPINSTRQEFAALLGGPVDLVIVALTDLPAVDLAGRADANQIAGQAEAQALQQVTDPEELRFRRDRQIAERIFGDLLRKYPRLYVLQNGFDLILPDHLVGVLMRRVVSGVIVRNREAVQFKF